MAVNVQEAAADRHLVLYDNFYLAQHLPDKKAKFILPVNSRSLIYNTLRVLGIIYDKL